MLSKVRLHRISPRSTTPWSVYCEANLGLPALLLSLHLIYPLGLTLDLDLADRLLVLRYLSAESGRQCERG